MRTVLRIALCSLPLHLFAAEVEGKPVFILTADLHNSFAIKVTDRVWEFASGPLNSLPRPA